MREIPTYHNSLVQLAEKQQRERELAQEAYLVGCRGVHLKILISWQARVSEMKCRFRGAGGVGGGAAPPPAADHSHVKQVHVECKENKETAPAGLFQHVAWFVASSLVLVHVLVGCLLWLLLNALVVIVVAVGLC